MGEVKKILVFGGTTEGRQIARYLDRPQADVTVCVATEYGKSLLAGARHLQIREGRLPLARMAEMMTEQACDLVIDATHPYALEASGNIREACRQTGTPYLRVLREADGNGGPGPMPAAPSEGNPSGSCFFAENVSAAVSVLEAYEGPILLTTGSKDLPVYMRLAGAEGRIYVRILPDPVNMEKALSLGVRRDHLICMQGPFDTDMNAALIRHIRRREGARGLILVTKDSGREGGFPEKVKAAAQEGADLLILGRPPEKDLPRIRPGDPEGGWRSSFPLEEDGTAGQACASLEETLDWLAFWGAFSPEGQEARQGKDPGTVQPEESLNEKTAVYLIGTGLSEAQLTRQALEALEEADLLIGAGSVVRKSLGISVDSGQGPFSEILWKGRKRRLLISYDYPFIAAFLAEHRQIRRAALLFSGDIGFFSGADRIRSCLSEAEKACGAELFEIIPVSGISSAVHFLDRIGRPWQDVSMISLHGQDMPVAVRLASEGKLLAILGSKSGATQVCRRLLACQMADARVWIGADLMQEEEIIVSGRPEDFTETEFSPISLIYMEWEEPYTVTGGLPDETFLRGRVPMTKEMVRAAILSKLALTADSVLYDIGAGTGSVSIEAARLMPRGRVIAVEKNPEGIALIRENAQRLHTDNVIILEGEAPDCLFEDTDTGWERGEKAAEASGCSGQVWKKGLPLPTHAFIGGSSGKLEEMVRILLERNPRIRIVVTAVTMETVADLCRITAAMEKERTDKDPVGSSGRPRPQMLQLSVSAGTHLGRYHMLKPENPVWLFLL